MYEIPSFDYPHPPARDAISPLILKGLSLSLFGCGPENLINLSREERTHCTGSINAASLRGTIPGAVVTRARHADHWEAAIAERNGGIKAPCSDITKLADGSSAVMVDSLCALRGVLDVIDVLKADK